ncbi:MAG TPA: TonB-dependent receptor [Longimicrobiales bacterium]|nr:TonB-dependent receptor [Longimicrobiales bacterium]
MLVVRTAVAAAAALLVLVPRAARAQEGTTPEDTLIFRVDPVIVTATRGPRLVSEVPRPVSVFQRRDLVETAPNTISDLFRTVPGLDVTGVGVQQVRPQIRGQSGQRILLLSDGLRLNNTRRQRDFGEIPALVDVTAVEQVEVVRGPASVLYGSDAIAGVVNVITRSPVREGFRGTISGLYGTASELRRVSARASGRTGALSLQGGASLRRSGSYEAPAGTFGEITLADDARVHDTGIEDLSADLRAGWNFSERVEVFGKVEHYEAEEAGFGFVSPDAYAPGDPEIEILYPDQRFQKLTLGLRAQELDAAVADRVEVTTYGQDNERELHFGAFIPFGPGSGMELDNRNFTDIRTYGLRAEASKLLAGRVLLTYGVDGFRDRAEGTDNNTSTITGFGPPMVETSNAPSLPEAEYLSLGAFAQVEVDVTDRLSVVLGGRYQDVSAETFATANLNNTPIERSDNTVVWAANAMYEVVDGLHLIGSVGRGFRSPNLVELFFDGTVPEASAYQAPAGEDLEAEKSLGFDVGGRLVRGPLFLEAFYFRNEITDGIRSEPVRDAVGNIVQTNGFDTYRNVNLDEVVLQGVEVSADLRLENGIELGGSLSTLDAEDAIDPDNPIGESYATKLTGRLGYRDPGGRFWAQWETRHSGEQKDAALEAGNPLGAVLPAFTVHGVRAGARLAEIGGLTYGVTLSLANVTNDLYAETANAGFFRPEPGRNLTVTLDVSF